ncbi:MAG: hypothetical protein PHN90_00395 [Methanothrix sp.]|jgi:hypothetical protein|nr:hypothetical protein [Methanothrix sp.]
MVGVMVSFQRYLQLRDDTEPLKDILAILAACRGAPQALDDIMRKLPPETKRDTVDNRLRLGIKRGFVKEVIDEEEERGDRKILRRGRGRPPKRYELDNRIWDDYQEFLNTPEKIERGYGMGLNLRLADDDDVKRLEASGMAQCPSCGNPTSRNSIFKSPDGKMVCITCFQSKKTNTLQGR